MMLPYLSHVPLSCTICKSEDVIFKKLESTKMKKKIVIVLLLKGAIEFDCVVGWEDTVLHCNHKNVSDYI
jgi:hypothetical protein